jgi:hypothetical protein
MLAPDDSDDSDYLQDSDADPSPQAKIVEGDFKSNFFLISTLTLAVILICFVDKIY